MQPIIRRATPADAATIVEFNRCLAAESEGKSLDSELLARGVAAGLADPNKALYWVALLDGGIVGQIMITREWSDWRDGWFWWIQSVYVHARQRRRGIFRALFDHVCQCARTEAQVIGLRLYVERANDVARQTYARLGMTATGYHVFERYPL